MSPAQRLYSRQMLRRFLQRQTSSTAKPRNIIPRVERLEERTLLAAAPFADVADGMNRYLESEQPGPWQVANAAPILWDGVETYARRSQWIVQFEDVEGTLQEQVDAIQQRLDETDFSGYGMVSPRDHGAKVTDHLGSDGLVVVSADGDDVDFDELREPLIAMGGVEYVEPNFVDLQQASTFPDEPLFDQLYGLHNTGQMGGWYDADIDAPEAWDVTTGSRDIVVAVIDSGVDYSHPDLAANMWKNPGEVAGNGIDDDGNGYVDDVYGYDFINNDADPMDDNNHGTHVAGTIGAIGDNLLGVTGVNWNIQIMALKFLGADNFGPTSAAVQAINYASMMRRDFGVNIVLTNNSWGGGAHSNALRSAIEASGEEDMLFVAAAGNGRRNTDFSPNYPSSYDLDNIISVAATDHRDQRAWFSNYGSQSVDLGAPGVSILSTLPGGSYGRFNGTSMAAPHVAGVAALAWSVAPQASYSQIRDAILDGVDPVSSMAGVTVTGGRLNASKTLDQLGMMVSASSPAEGDMITSPATEFAFTFSEAVDPATVDADDLLVNGITADAVSITGADTVVFSYASSPVTSQGLQTMSIAAAAIGPADGGKPVQGWVGNFRYDALPMEVLATTPDLDSTVLLPLSRVEVHLNEPYDASGITTEDLQTSQGTVAGYELVDEDTIAFFVDGVSEEGAFAVAMSAGALRDIYGNPMLRFDGAFDLDVGTFAYPTPLEPKLPRGSLIYDPERRGVIGAAGDQDTFTLHLDPGQTVTVVVSSDENLQAAVEITPPTDEDAQPVQAIAGSAGETVVLQGVPTRGRLIGNGPGAATYEITVTGAAGSTGNYTLQVVLNANIESEQHGGGDNGSMSKAQSLAGAFLPISHAVDDTDEDVPPSRAAILGKLTGGGHATLPSHLGSVEGNSNNGLPLHIGNWAGPSMRYQQIYSAADFSGGGVIDELRFRRNANEVGFREADIDIQINLSYAATTVSTISGRFSDNIGSGYVTVFDGLLNLESLGSGTPKPFDIVIDVDDVFAYDPSRGDLLVEMRVRNPSLTTFFDAANFTQQTTTNRLYAWDANAVFGVHSRMHPYGLVTQFGYVEDEDWYSFTRNVGESTTVALTELAGGNANVDLIAPDGSILARGVSEPSNMGEVIANFSADDTAGTYYVRVSGAADVEYSLVVTRSADHEREGNDTLTTAQDLIASEAAGGHWALGHAGEQRERLFALPRGGGSSIVELDPVTGAEINRIPSPEPVSGLADGLAFDGESLFFMNSWEKVPVLWQLDPDTGAVLDSDMLDTSFRLYDGLAALGGEIYISDYGADDIIVFDPITDTITRTLDVNGRNPGVDLFGGIGAIQGADALVALDRSGARVLIINPATGEVTNAFPAGGIPAYGLTVIDDEIYLGRSTGNTADVYSVGGLFQRTVGLPFSVSGLGGGMTDAAPDFYAVTVNEGRTLMVETYTPGDGLGEFVSRLNPMARIYDSTGQLVAQDDDSSADGRNVKLSYRVPHGSGGSYYVEILPSDATDEPTAGEYVLNVKHTGGAGPAFEAQATTPPNGLRTRSVPTRLTVDYNDTILLPTVDPSDLSVAGVAATGVTVADGNTLSFDLPPRAVYWDPDEGGNGHYYMVANVPTNWQDAEQYAVELGGHLVSINSEREQKFLKHHFLSGDQQRNAYWIGITDQDAEGTFRWTSGEPVTFTNWHWGEPNDWGNGEDYGVINWHFAFSGANVIGTWNDDSGRGLRPSIIELADLPEAIWHVDDGAHQFATAAGAIADVQNSPLSEFNSQIVLDLTAPQVVATSPQFGAVAVPGDLEVAITFSEPMATETIDASELILQGLFRGGTYTPSDLWWNTAGTELTLSYFNLSDDRYTLVLPSGDSGAKDLVGWQLDGEGGTLPSGDGFEGGDVVLTFAVDPSGEVSFPTPSAATAPLGSLIYSRSNTGTVAYGGDQDDFTLDIDPGQSVTVVVEVGGDLQPRVEIADPSGTVLRTAMAGAAGEPVVVQVPASDGGVYTIGVSGAGDSMGLYTVQTVLNADVERELYGVENNSIGTAQSLESSFIPLLKDTERGAVIGRADGPEAETSPDGFGYVASAVPYEFEDISATGTAIPAFYYSYPGWLSRNDGYAPLVDAQLGDFQFEFYGETYSELYVSTNGLLTFGAGVSSPYNADLKWSPWQATIAAFWDDLDFTYGGGQVYWKVQGSGDDQQLIVQWNDVRFWSSWSGDGITFQAVLSEADDSIQFNYRDLNGGKSWLNEGRSATVGIKDEGWQGLPGDDRLLVSWNNAFHPYVGTGKSLRIAVPTPAADYYSIELNIGDKVTLAATSPDLGAVGIEIVDGSSTTLATGTFVNTNVGNVIPNFEAPADGTYYVRVMGDSGADYSLVATRNAVFDTEGNNSLQAAQDFAGLEVALGHLGGPMSMPGHVRIAVHANDGDWISRYEAQRVVDQLNDSTAFDFTATLATNDELDTVPELENFDVVVMGSKFWHPFPLNVAQAMRAWVQSGKGGLVAAGTAYKQLAWYSAPAVRAELDPIIPLNLSSSAVAPAFSPITVIDSSHPVTAGVERITGHFFGESSYYGADPDARILGVEGSSANRPAITISEASGGRSVHLAPLYASYSSLRVPGSPADTLLEQAVAWASPPVADEADIYFFTAEAGANLDLFTITPADGAGEFLNTLDPHLTLYDADGTIVATGVPTADGRNEQILYTVPDGAGGVYRIAVTAERGTAGEYVLDPISIVAPGIAVESRPNDILPSPFIGSSLATSHPTAPAVDEHAMQHLYESMLRIGAVTTFGADRADIELHEEDRHGQRRILPLARIDDIRRSRPQASEDEPTAMDNSLVDSLFADEAFLRRLLPSSAQGSGVES